MIPTLQPGGPAVLDGATWHERRERSRHRFEMAASYVWIDPDRPRDITDHHRWWSARRWAPVELRRDDYGDPARPHVRLADQVRADIEHHLHLDVGAVRMLTQPRRLGWLFNPITVYLAWRSDPASNGLADPVAAVLEVTNTPWKERHRYPVSLQRERPDSEWVVSHVDKKFHVSPFLQMGYRYRIRLRRVDDRLDLRIDVVGEADDGPALRTGLAGALRPPSRATLSRSLCRQPFATMKVSLGIHVHAAMLWAKRVPFIAHPDRSA